MARATREQPIARGLSPQATLFALKVIDKAIESWCRADAPRTVAALGGPAFIQSRFGRITVGETSTTIGILGPVPRLTIAEFEAMMAEHEEQKKEVRDTLRGVCAVGERPGSESPSCPPLRARSLVLQR